MIFIWFYMGNTYNCVGSFIEQSDTINILQIFEKSKTTHVHKFCKLIKLRDFFSWYVTTDSTQEARGENDVTMYLWCIIHLFLT